MAVLAGECFWQVLIATLVQTHKRQKKKRNKIQCTRYSTRYNLETYWCTKLLWSCLLVGYLLNLLCLVLSVPNRARFSVHVSFYLLLLSTLCHLFLFLIFYWLTHPLSNQFVVLSFVISIILNPSVLLFRVVIYVQLMVQCFRMSSLFLFLFLY